MRKIVSETVTLSVRNPVSEKQRVMEGSSPVKKNGYVWGCFSIALTHIQSGISGFPLKGGQDMLTLAELKHFMPIPVLEENYPTAKYLKTHGTIFVSKSIATNVKISVYQNGYALYEISGLATVFPIWDCQNYRYEMEQNEISEQWFEKEAWYLRLILEGEDRINRNLETRQQRKSISYSAVSEEWGVLGSLEATVLETAIRKEMIQELFGLLTERQKEVVFEYFWEQKSQSEIAEKLGVSHAAVSKILTRAVTRLRKKCMEWKEAV